MSDIWADTFRDIQSGFADAGDPDMVTLIYQPIVGDPRSCTSHVRKGNILQPGGFTSSVSVQEITIEAALDDLGKEPIRDETFTAPDGTIYKVLSAPENNGHSVKIQVTL